MRHRKRTDKLGRKSAHRQATLSNIVASVLEHERVTTTFRLAKSARRYTDKMITLAKQDTLHARRQAISFLRPSGPERKDVVRKLFSELGERYAQRPGGYTRIVKLRPRRGDNAPMAVLELVDATVTFKEKKKRVEDEELDVEMEVDGDLQSQDIADDTPNDDATKKKSDDLKDESPATHVEETDETETKTSAPAETTDTAAPEPAAAVEGEEEIPAKADDTSADTHSDNDTEKSAEQGDDEDKGKIKGFFKHMFHKDEK